MHRQVPGVRRGSSAHARALPSVARRGSSMSESTPGVGRPRLVVGLETEPHAAPVSSVRRAKPPHRRQRSAHARRRGMTPGRRGRTPLPAGASPAGDDARPAGDNVRPAGEDARPAARGDEASALNRRADLSVLQAMTAPRRPAPARGRGARIASPSSFEKCTLASKESGVAPRGGRIARGTDSTEPNPGSGRSQRISPRKAAGAGSDRA